LGEDAAGLSPTNIARLTACWEKEYADFRHRHHEEAREGPKMDIRTLGIDLAKFVSGPRGGRARPDGGGARASPPAAIAVRGAASTVPGGDGGVRWRTLLGPRDCQRGHEVRLMSPRFVRPYVKSNKNDVRGAEAICEAVGRPSMRFVAVKSVAQQDMLALHRVRSLLIREDEREAFAFGFVMELRSIAVSDKRHSSTPLSAHSLFHLKCLPNII
jgi:hypothetical protein